MLTIYHYMAFIRRLKRGESTYLVEVESYRKKGKIKQRYLRYVGKEVDGVKVLTGSIANAEVTKVTVYGPLLALHELAKDMDLPEVLGEYYAELLSLVYAHCIQPNSLTKITEWFERTDLNRLLTLKNLTEKKLLDAMDYYDGERIERIQKKLFDKLKEKYALDYRGIFYDITNVYFHGKQCPLAKLGHNSEGLMLPQIQVGLAVTREGGLPIFHRTYPGNIHGSKTLAEVMLAFREYGVKDATIVWDRGVTSAVNVRETRDLGAHVLCGIPVKGEVKKIVDGVEGIVNIKNMVRLRNTTFYVTSRSYNYQGVNGTLIICNNPRVKDVIREERYKRILEAKDARDKGVQVPKGLKKYFYKKGLNMKDIADAERYDGVSAIFTTKKLSGAEVVRVYFEKDKVEKAFRALKSITQIKPVRHWLEDRVKTHVFICYLSYLLLSLLEYKLEKKKIDLSASDALKKLHTIYKVYIKDAKSGNTFEKTVTYTKEHQQILEAINPQLTKA
jgi:transposase